jgi:hypothetical protein
MEAPPFIKSARSAASRAKGVSWLTMTMVIFSCFLFEGNLLIVCGGFIQKIIRAVFVKVHCHGCLLHSFTG